MIRSGYRTRVTLVGGSTYCPDYWHFSCCAVSALLLKNLLNYRINKLTLGLAGLTEAGPIKKYYCLDWQDKSLKARSISFILISDIVDSRYRLCYGLQPSYPFLCNLNNIAIYTTCVSKIKDKICILLYSILICRIGFIQDVKTNLISIRASRLQHPHIHPG